MTDDSDQDEQEDTEDENQYGGGEQDIDATEQTEMREDDEGEPHDDDE